MNDGPPQACRRRNGACAAGVLALLAMPGVGGAQSANPLQLSAQHVTLSVADIDRATDWYVQVLGFRKLSRAEPDPDTKLQQLAIPGYRIDLLWQKGSKRPAPSAIPDQGWVHVVFKTSQIEAAQEVLTRKGTDVHAFTAGATGLTRLIVHDPEGNEVEILDARLDNTN